MKRLKIIIPLLIALMLCSCGNKADQENVWTGVDEAMSHESVEFTTTTTVTTAPVTDEQGKTQTQTKKVERNIVTNLTTTATETTTVTTDTDVQTESVGDQSTTNNVPSFQQVNPLDYFDCTLPNGWSSQYQNGSVILSSSNNDTMVLNTFSVTANGCDDETVLTQYLNNIAVSYSVSSIQQYNSWYYAQIQDSNGTYNLYFIKYSNFVISLIATTNNDIQTDVETVLNSLQTLS